jgi:hypothetical protein
MNDDNKDLDDILSALAVSNISSKSNKVKETDVEEYDEAAELIKTLRALDDLIESNAEVMEEAKGMLAATGDVNYFEAYSSLGKAQADALKNKVKMITDKESNKITRDSKNREITVKEKLADHQIGIGGGSPHTLNQTNNVIMSGSREEMFEMLSKLKAHEKEVNLKVIE